MALVTSHCHLISFVFNYLPSLKAFPVGFHSVPWMVEGARSVRKATTTGLLTLLHEKGNEGHSDILVFLMFLHLRMGRGSFIFKTFTL